MTKHRTAFGLEALPGTETLGGAEFVYRQLLDAILSQRLAPATRLREEALAGIFEVGRSTIRNALQRLAHEGAVELRANRGATVALPGAGETAEVLEARRVIECELVRRAAERLRRARERDASAPANDSPELDALRSLAREEGEHLAAGRRGAALRLAGEFHLALARLGGNRPLAAALERLITRTSLAIGAYERPAHGFDGWRSRLALLDLVAGGDGAAAARAMHAHLDALESTLDAKAGSPSELDAAFVHLKETAGR